MPNLWRQSFFFTELFQLDPIDFDAYQPFSRRLIVQSLLFQSLLPNKESLILSNRPGKSHSER